MFGENSWISSEIVGSAQPKCFGGRWVAMDEKQLESLRSLDWEEIAAKVTSAALFFGARYGWRRDSVLPGGKLIEDVVFEAIADLWADPTRLTARCDFPTQLKGIVRSKLWNLSQSGDEKVTRTSTLDENYASRTDGPEHVVDVRDEFDRVIELVSSHPKVKAKPELEDVVTAVACGAMDVAAIAAMTNLPRDRVYQLQRELQPVYASVARELCEEGRAP